MSNKDRGRKGILGVNHNRNRPTIFAFCPTRGDEWPSGSDNSDEDFDPDSISEDEMTPINDGKCLIVNPTKSTKRHLKKIAEKERKLKLQNRKERNKKRKTRDNSKDDQKKESPQHGKRMKTTNSPREESDNESNVDICTWDRLPIIIIQKIFYFVVMEEGPIPFLLRMSRVSSSWREAARTSSLWKSVNLSSDAVKIEESKKLEALWWLVDNRFSKLEELNLSNWSKLHHTSLMKIIERCPNIKRINLTGCMKLTASSVTSLVNDLPNLISVDLTSFGILGQKISPATISHLLEKRGSQLEEIILSKNCLRKWPAFLKPFLTPNSLPKLKLLDLSNCLFNNASSGVFPVESFQHACPNLEILRLAGCCLTPATVSAGVQQSSPGFPNLAQLSFPVKVDSHRASGPHFEDILQRILKTSTKLQLLDIRGRISFTEDFVQNLCCTDVEYLYINSCDQTILPTCQKWGHSLIVVDLSDLTVKEGNTISEVFSSMKIIEQLDVSGTDIKNSDLRILFQMCTSLTKLQLKRCRSLPRGLKQVFEGERLKQLMADIIKSTDSG